MAGDIGLLNRSLWEFSSFYSSMKIYMFWHSFFMMGYRLKSTLERDIHWIRFGMKVFGYVAAVNLFVLPILWVSNILSALVFVYEGAVLVLVGGAQFLLSFLYYRRNSDSKIDQRYPYPGSGWLDHRILFKRLKPEERKRYRQEGMITVMVGFTLWLVALATHFLIFIH